MTDPRETCRPAIYSSKQMRHETTLRVSLKVETFFQFNHIELRILRVNELVVDTLKSQVFFKNKLLNK